MANYFEIDYYKNGNTNSKEKYRKLNILVFTIALTIYIYFLGGNYRNIQKLSAFDSKSKIKFNELNYLASILIVVAGAILLYIAIFDENLETEISFN